MNTNISLPKPPKLVEKIGKNRAIFEIEELHPGYGLTIGNALRRVMLSSLPGAAVTSVKIKGVKHEFTTLTGVMEDIVELILNLKQVRFKLHGDDSQTVTLKAKGEGEVKAGDIKLVSQVEIANPEAHVATLTSKNAALDLEMTIEKGLGYYAVESRKKEKADVDSISIDAIFTPIKKINYEVENMRVGDRTDYNRLKFDIETDGTIGAEEALTKAAKILIDHYEIIARPMTEKKEKAKKSENTEAAPEIKKAAEDSSKIKVEDLKLSSRTLKALVAAHVKTVAGLERHSEKELMNLEGLGEKAIKEIKKALGKLGITLKSDETS